MYIKECLTTSRSFEWSRQCLASNKIVNHLLNIKSSSKKHYTQSLNFTHCGTLCRKNVKDVLVKRIPFFGFLFLCQCQNIGQTESPESLAKENGSLNVVGIKPAVVAEWFKSSTMFKHIWRLRNQVQIPAQDCNIDRSEVEILCCFSNSMALGDMCRLQYQTERDT